MSELDRRPGSRLTRRQREQRAYRLVLATGGFAVLFVAGLVLSLGGWTVLFAVLAVLSGLWLWRTVRP